MPDYQLSLLPYIRADVLLTDLPDLMNLLGSNIRKNAKSFSILPRALPLMWCVINIHLPLFYAYYKYMCF